MTKVAEPFAQPAAKLIGLRPELVVEEAWSSGSSALMRSTIGSKLGPRARWSPPNRDELEHRVSRSIAPGVQWSQSAI